MTKNMQPAKVEIRIVAGTLRGRRLTCIVNPELRPTPQRVREALFSILGNAVPNRPFYDIFAGTGIHGLEALSRGASEGVFLERDPKLAAEIEKNLHKYNIADKGQVIRNDAYRWAERWLPPQRPLNLFLSPPFEDLVHNPDRFIELVRILLEKIPDESTISVQTEGDIAQSLPPAVWDTRTYGRNILSIAVKGDSLPESVPTENE